ncbi:MAG: energy-coupling factor transporter transmembrane protein EcfT [Clostridia bacterium]|nr:energy-coupling factor transporter transmembrane protein EcfT [Clostridia bacterium]MBO5777475.1 energy-coupling factor transporter transmembrane protein EcfT [Clostridia bacterium]MBR5173568.1 energy-coupling factor transporter transmembrane protein EcfT [Clostridia bacterium]
MFKDVAFGQYYPANSPIHRMDARVKLLLTILFVVSIFFIKSYFGFMLTAVLLVAVILIARLPMMSVLKSIRGVLFVMMLTALINLFLGGENGSEILWQWKFLTITETSVHTTIKLVLRLVLLISGATLLSLTTTPVELADGVESLLTPLKLIRVPVRDIAMIMSIALRFIPTLFEETNKVVSAQKSRGAAFDTGNPFARIKALLPVLIPLFVSSFRRADELAFAMDSRCYNASEKRVKMRTHKIGLVDIISSLTMCGYVVVIMLDTYYWKGLVDTLMFGGLL